MDDEFIDDIRDALRPRRIICYPPMDHSLINSFRRCICCRGGLLEYVNVHVEYASIAQKNAGETIIHSTKHDVMIL